MVAGRLSKEDTYQMKKAVADIIFNHKDEIEFTDGKPSPISIAKLLKEHYNYIITRQTVAKYLKEGLDRYRQELLLADNDKIRDIREAMRVQKAIWNDTNEKSVDRTKAANAWRALHKQLMEYEEMLATAQIRLAEVKKPVYQIKFNPPSIVVTCPKCKHEFYNSKNEEVEDEKRIKFRTDEKQRSFDNFNERVVEGDEV